MIYHLLTSFSFVVFTICCSILIFSVYYINRKFNSEKLKNMLSEHNEEHRRIENSFITKMNEIKTYHDNSISQLEDSFSTKMSEIKTYHDNTISQLEEKLKNLSKLSDEKKSTKKTSPAKTK